jgi:nucleotide-binding universal stress UspA family protein
MIKRILVPTDGSESAGLGVRYALALAKRWDAHLLGLYVVDVKLLEGPFLRDLSASLGTAPYVNYQGNMAMLLDERGQVVLEGFGKACTEAGVAFETSQVTGVVPREIIAVSEPTDMIVMGRGGEHNEWLEGLIGSTTESVIRGASQPVLVTGTDELGDTRFLVAYDGTQHSQHALKAAAMIAADWGMEFHVLTVGEDRKHLEEAEHYLQAYDVDVEYITRDGEAGEEIVRYAEECGADFLVMGAYRHSKIHDLIVGSTTTYAINHSPCPVLLHR